MGRLLLLAVLALLLATTGRHPAAGEDDATPESPWIGLEGVDPSRTPAPPPDLPAGLLVRTTPVSWGRLVPVAPLRGGRQLHDWEALDAFVAAWQEAGHDLVLVLGTTAPWRGAPEGTSAWEEALARWLPDGARDAVLRAEPGGPRELAPGRWDDWQRFVRDVVERYDADGRDDAPGLAGPVRWIQVLDTPYRPRSWSGSPEAYVRLLHHARLGARAASPTARIVHGGIVGDAAEGGDTNAIRRWAHAFAEGSLGLSPVFDAVVVAGGRQHDEDADRLRRTRRVLDALGRKEVEVWLASGHGAKLGRGPRARVGDVPSREAQVRARWLRAVDLEDHGDHEQALAWYRRGCAFDLVRTLIGGRAAGAARVLLVEDPRAGLSTGTLAQARRHVGWGADPAILEAGGGAVALRFLRAGPAGAAAVIALVPDPDEDWAGDPREDPVLREVVVRLAPGTYHAESVATPAADPVSTTIAAPDGILRLSVGPSPLYVWPVLEGASGR